MQFLQRLYLGMSFINRLWQFSKIATELYLNYFIDKMSINLSVCVKPHNFFPNFSRPCDENCHLLKEHSLLSILQY